MKCKVQPSLLHEGVLAEFSFADWLHGKMHHITLAMTAYSEELRAAEVKNTIFTETEITPKLANTPDILFWLAVIRGEITSSVRNQAVKVAGVENPIQGLRQACDHAIAGYQHGIDESHALDSGVFPFVEIVKRGKIVNKLPKLEASGGHTISINPFYLVSSHSFNGIEPMPILSDLRQIREFADSAQSGLTLIKRFSHGIEQEMRYLLKYIIPLDCPRDKAYSGSHSSLPGIIFVSSSLDDIRVVAEMLLHEALHSKLFLLQKWDDLFLTSNDIAWLGQRLYSPWRQCMRPVQGLLHGAFVFCGIADFWRSLSTSSTDLPARRAATAAMESLIVSQSLINYAHLSEWGRNLVISVIDYNIQILDNIPNWELLRAWSPDRDVKDGNPRLVTEMMNDYTKVMQNHQPSDHD